MGVQEHSFKSSFHQRVIFETSFWQVLMKYKWTAAVLAAPAMLLACTVVVSATRPFTIDDIFKIKSVRDPQIFPEGKQVALVISVPSLEKNRSNSDVWLMSVDGTGGSFGGFMVDWIEGHTNRFKALIAHAGPSDQVSFFGETEELWFPIWGLKGTPWSNWNGYVDVSPIKYAPNFKTPMLLTHGELDYRVLIGQSEDMFTALQRMGVESKFVRLPDEGHWVLKPQNQKF
jgi:dipeptidyl aminopeptidase/acylaminoacyl peptidase